MIVCPAAPVNLIEPVPTVTTASEPSLATVGVVLEVILILSLAAVKSGKIRTVAAAAKALGRAGLRVDYVECVDAETLEPRRRISRGCCVLVAAYCGKTRLIDNVKV